MNDPVTPWLLQRTYRNPTPLLILPPLPHGDVAPLLGAPALMAVVRQWADTLELVNDALQETLGRDSLRIYCTEAIETVLRAGTLATADGRSVIWAYQPTRAATPVVWMAA